MNLTRTKDRVVCVSAASKWYVVGKEYVVYQDHKGVRYVQGSDGFYDDMNKCVSKFKRDKDETKQRESKG